MAGGPRRQGEGEEQRRRGQRRQAQDGELDAGGEGGECVRGGRGGGEAEDGGEREGRDGVGDALWKGESAGVSEDRAPSMRNQLMHRELVLCCPLRRAARRRYTEPAEVRGERRSARAGKRGKRQGKRTVSRPRETVPTNLRSEMLLVAMAADSERRRRFG